MNEREFLYEAKLGEVVRQIDNAITKKYTIHNETFDAWYTNRDFILKELWEAGYKITSTMRKKGNVEWKKDLPASNLK